MKSSQTKSIDIDPVVEQLLALMRQFPSVRDEADLSLGRKTISISMDSIYLSRMLDPKPFRDLQTDVLREAINDLAAGAITLMNSYLGIKIDAGRLVRASDFYSSPESLVYKIELKDAAAFQNSSNRRDFEFHEKTANAAIYYLIDQLSK